MAINMRAMYEYGGFSCLRTPAPDFFVVDTTLSSESGSVEALRLALLLDVQLFVVLTAGMLMDSSSKRVCSQSWFTLWVLSIVLGIGISTLTIFILRLPRGSACSHCFHQLSLTKPGA